MLRSRTRAPGSRQVSPRPSPATRARGRTALVPRVVLGLALATGAGSLVLFALFLWGWPGTGIRWTATGALLWDAGLSLAFFVQHSGMVRRSFRKRLAELVPERYLGAAYTIASGLVLGAVVLLWRGTESRLLALEGPWRWAARACWLLAIFTFSRSVRALGSFDPFGLDAIRAGLRGRPDEGPPTFTVEGPYRWVRHPLYSCVLVLIWTCPTVTADRLLFDLLWTVWIYVGATLEERDLVAAFGDAYRRYREKVPMLVPWRGRVAVDADVRTLRSGSSRG